MQTYDVYYPRPLPSGSYEIGIVVPVWNRPRYFRRFLESLAKSELPDVLIVLIDDKSTDAETLALFDEFEHPHAPIVKCRVRWRRTLRIHEHLRFGWDMLANAYSCRYLANIDSDMIMHPNWLARVRELYAREYEKRGPIIVSGFNKFSGITLEKGRDYNVRRFIGGAHMFFDAETYHRMVRPNLRAYWDEYVVEAMYAAGHACLTTRPSCMQHIGRHGMFSKLYRYDMALDYSWMSRFYLPAYPLLFGRLRKASEKTFQSACRGNSAYQSNLRKSRDEPAEKRL